jgi:hypothetical protein
MKSGQQKGFIVPVLLVIIALLVVGGGVYIYENKKSEAPTATNNNKPQPLTQQQPAADQNQQNNETKTTQTPSSKMDDTPIVKPSISVVGMQVFPEPDFGFYFWLPNTWTVESVAIKDKYVGGIVQKTLTIGPPSDPHGTSGDAITIDEFYSPTREITIARDLCSPMSGSFVAAHRYYFDTNAHTWMIETPAYSGQSEKDGSTYNVPASTKAADVSNNTMGGLHMLGAGCSGYVIPLSDKNFVVFSFNSRNVGPYYGNIAKTIIATDPSVATPVSTNEQIKTITIAGLTLGGLGTSIGNQWRSYNGAVYDNSAKIIPGANAATFHSMGNGFATDGVHVYAENGLLVDADPSTFTVIKGNDGHASFYEKDKSHVWHISTLIPGADPATFAFVLDVKQPGYDFFTKDATHVWYLDKIIPGADAPTFSILNQTLWASKWFETDKSHVWYDAKLIPGADPNTFVVDSNDQSNETITMHDARHSYKLFDIFGYNAAHQMSSTTVSIDGGIPMPLQ